MDVKDDELDDPVSIREAAESEFKLDLKAQRMMQYIKENVPISGIVESLTEDLWLREVLKDVDSTNPFVRSRALSMLGKFLKIGEGKKKNAPTEVDFQ